MIDIDTPYYLGYDAALKAYRFRVAGRWNPKCGGKYCWHPYLPSSPNKIGAYDAVRVKFTKAVQFVKRRIRLYDSCGNRTYDRSTSKAADDYFESYAAVKDQVFPSWQKTLWNGEIIYNDGICKQDTLPLSFYGAGSTGGSGGVTFWGNLIGRNFEYDVWVRPAIAAGQCRGNYSLKGVYHHTWSDDTVEFQVSLFPFGVGIGAASIDDSFTTNNNADGDPDPDLVMGQMCYQPKVAVDGTSGVYSTRHVGAAGGSGVAGGSGSASAPSGESAMVRVGTDGQLYEAVQTGFGQPYGAWRLIPGSAGVVGPKVIYANGYFAVYGRKVADDGDGSDLIFGTSRPAGATGYGAMGPMGVDSPSIHSDPAVTVTPSGLIVIYARSDDQMWGTGQSTVGGTFGPWMPIGGGGSGLDGNPTAVVNDNGLIAVYSRTAGGVLVGASQSTAGGLFGGWGPIGTGSPTLVGSPAALVVPGGQIVVYSRASNGTVWGAGQSASGGLFGSWQPIGTAGGGVVGDPQAVLVNGRISIFARTDAGGFSHVTQPQPGSIFGTWQQTGSVQPRFTSEPSVLVSGSQIIVSGIAGDDFGWETRGSAAMNDFWQWSRKNS